MAPNHCSAKGPQSSGFMEDWSVRSNRYNEERNRQIWNSLTVGTDANYFVYLANKHGRGPRRQPFSERIKAYEPLTLPIKTEIFNSQYVPFIYYNSADTVVVKSDTG